MLEEPTPVLIAAGRFGDGDAVGLTIVTVGRSIVDRLGEDPLDPDADPDPPALSRFGLRGGITGILCVVGGVDDGGTRIGIGAGAGCCCICICIGMGIDDERFLPCVGRGGDFDGLDTLAITLTFAFAFAFAFVAAFDLTFSFPFVSALVEEEPVRPLCTAVIIFLANAGIGGTGGGAGAFRGLERSGGLLKYSASARRESEENDTPRRRVRFGFGSVVVVAVMVVVVVVVVVVLRTD